MIGAGQTAAGRYLVHLEIHLPYPSEFRAMIRTAHHFPRVAVVVDVATQGERLERR